MKRKVPVVPTLIVLIACAIMVRLGFWQVGRLHEKEAMLARFDASERLGDEVAWVPPPLHGQSAGQDLTDPSLYRRSRIDCLQVSAMKSVSGQNAKGNAGYAHVATCVLADGSSAPVVLGWSNAPRPPQWQGGSAITGWRAPGPRLVADPPLAGLLPNARPDPRDIPNNHLSYAVQWFAFAVVALVIYALALRKRWLGK